MTQPHHDWTILSNHGMVLFHIAANPDITQRALSDTLGISERHVARIVQDLATAEMVQVQRQGRRNSYTVNPDACFRHPTLAHIPLRRIITAVTPEIAAQGSDSG